MSGEIISRRLVMFFPGFEPLDAEAHHKRFVRGAERTAKVWAEKIEVGALDKGELRSFQLVDGRVKTSFVICDLSPIMQTMSTKSTMRRTASGLLAMAGFILNGTLISYFKTSWRYGLFFLYPSMMLAAMIAVSVFVGRIGGPLLALAQFVFLFSLACRYAHFLLMMDLWHYARTLARGELSKENALTVLLIQQCADRVASETKLGRIDEIVIVGHSIGAALAVELADRLTTDMKVPVGVLTLGSGLLQVACHPKALRFREMAKRLLGNGTHWLDVQALIDPINFLHSNLAEKYATPSANYREIIIRMRNLLSKPTYQRIKFNCFRVHRQYVLPVEVKQKYSFHRMMAGPTAFAELVHNGGLPDVLAKFEDAR